MMNGLELRRDTSDRGSKILGCSYRTCARDPRWCLAGLSTRVTCAHQSHSNDSLTAPPKLVQLMINVIFCSSFTDDTPAVVLIHKQATGGVPPPRKK